MTAISADIDLDCAHEVTATIEIVAVTLDFEIVAGLKGEPGASTDLGLEIISQNATLSSNKIYFADSLILLQLIMPSNPSLQDRIALTSSGSGLWRLYPSDKPVQIGDQLISTLGYIDSQNVGDSISFLYQGDRWITTQFIGFLDIST